MTTHVRPQDFSPLSVSLSVALSLYRVRVPSRGIHKPRTRVPRAYGGETPRINNLAPRRGASSSGTPPRRHRGARDTDRREYRTAAAAATMTTISSHYCSWTSCQCVTHEIRRRVPRAYLDNLSRRDRDVTRDHETLDEFLSREIPRTAESLSYS